VSEFERAERDDSGQNGKRPWTPDRRRAELESFRDLWHGGFFVANPAGKLAPFWLESMVGGYHVNYLTCIRPSAACGPRRSVLASKSASGSRTATTVDVDMLHSAKSHWSLLRCNI
jgi:hypothetical protein